MQSRLAPRWRFGRDRTQRKPRSETSWRTFQRKKTQKTKTPMDRQVLLVLVIVRIGNDSALGGTPSGLLYAELMGKCDIEDYTAVVSVGKEVGLIEEPFKDLLRLTPKGVELKAKFVKILEDHAVEDRVAASRSKGGAL